MIRRSTASPQRVSLRERFAYAGGDLAFNLVYVATGTYLMFFYTDVAGIPAATVGTIFLAARLLDGVWDLAVGALMEKFRSRFGKARPWLLYLALPYGVAATLLFTAPNFDETGKVIYAFVTYTLSAVIIYTAMNLPYGVLNALMTRDQAERGLLNTFRMIAAYVGALIVASLTLPLVEATGGGARGWTLTFGIYGILAVALFFITFKFCKERVGEGAETPEASSLGKPQSTFAISKGVRSVVTNKYWLALTLFGVVFLTNYSLMGIYPYYAKYILGDEGLSSLLFTFRTLIELGGVLIAIPFIRRIGKRNISLAGCLAMVGGQLIIAATPSSLTVVLIGLGVAGLGVGAIFGVLFAMIADTIEYEEWRSGIRAEGLIYAGATLGQKLGGALGGVAVGWLLGFGGYIEGGDDAQQPASALLQIEFIFIWLPLILTAAMVALLLFYRLDKEYPAILADLRAHELAAASEN